MAQLYFDDFVAPHWDDINEAGTSRASKWLYRTPGERWYIVNNRAHCGVAGVAAANVSPGTADYTVACDYILESNLPSLNLGIAGRMSTDGNTYYGVYYQDGELVLFKRVSGVTTSLDVWTSPLSYGGTVYRLALDMAGTTIRALINDVQRCTATDSSITAAGTPGIRAIGANDAYTGIHIDNYTVTDSTVPPPVEGAMVIGIIGI